MFIWYYHSIRDGTFGVYLTGTIHPLLAGYMLCNESYWLVPGTGD